MAKIPLEEAKKLSQKTLLKMIERAKNYLKKNKVYKDMCEERGVDVDVIDLIPMKFGDIDVSARTDHGIITLNYKLLCDGDFFKDYSYIIHECEHYFQQCFGDRPTRGAEEGVYLDNPYEQEGFQRQIEYLDDQYGENEAESYVEHLLDHHDVKDADEREDKKEKLMEKINDE